jgi:hypothetical protein
VFTVLVSTAELGRFGGWWSAVESTSEDGDGDGDEGMGHRWNETEGSRSEKNLLQSATVCITQPPVTGSRFNPDRLRHGTSVKAKNHVPCIYKIRLPPYRKHSPLYRGVFGDTVAAYYENQTQQKHNVQFVAKGRDSAR